MTAAKFFDCLYGELRGYRRWSISRQAERNQLAGAATIRSEAAALLQQRIADALQRFPEYAATVASHRGSLPSGEVELEALPLWTRADQNRLFEATPEPPLSGAFVNKTGGSTGVPLRYWATRTSWEWRMAVSDRGYAWAGAHKGVGSVYVWGTSIYPPGRTARWRGTIAGRLQRRVFFDSFQFDDAEKRSCCEVIDRVRPAALVGYAGNLVALAYFVKSNAGVLKWKAQTLVTAAEGLKPGERELLQETLTDEVFLSYGSREFMLIGMECRKHRGYHISADNLMVEVVDDTGAPASPGETGRILVTDLRNQANPFIRYEIGDLGALADPSEICSCGLPFPRLLRVDGRTQEVIRLPNGERLTALFIPHLMKEFDWIQGYQITQESPAGIAVNLLSDRELSVDLTDPIEKVLRGKVGQALQIAFHRVQQLEKTPSGKTPIVRSS